MVSAFLQPSTKQQPLQQQQQLSWQQPPTTQEMATARPGNNSSLIDLVNAR
jgi:hypothetical protein